VPAPPTFTPPTLSPPTLPPPRLSPLTPAPLPPFGEPDAAEARSTLNIAGGAEDIYQMQHGQYTTDEEALDVFVPDGVTLTIVRADSEAYCMTAAVDGTGEVFSYSSATRDVEVGDRC
jgi:hypothetical protein